MLPGQAEVLGSAECVEAAEAIADGDNSRRAPVGQTHEFAQLATSINRMTEQMLAATQSRMRVEKLATMGRIAAGISHEIGNPVSAIANYAHVLRMRMHVCMPMQAVHAHARPVHAHAGVLAHMHAHTHTHTCTRTRPARRFQR